MLYVLPIMGGGNGAGAVPLSEIYHSVTGRSREEYYSTAIAILTIANIFAIIFAALLDMIGKKYTWLSGEGELVRKASFKTEDDEKAGQITHRETAVGMVLSTTCFLLAYDTVDRDTEAQTNDDTEKGRADNPGEDGWDIAQQ